MSSIRETMQNFAVKQALNYVEGNPEENIPEEKYFASISSVDRR